MTKAILRTSLVEKVKVLQKLFQQVYQVISGNTCVSQIKLHSRAKFSGCNVLECFAMVPMYVHGRQLHTVKHFATIFHLIISSHALFFLERMSVTELRIY